MRKHFEPLITSDFKRRAYDYVNISLADSQTNYDVKENESEMFNNLDFYSSIYIDSDQNISVRFNNTSYGAIPITAGRPLQMDNLIEITEIYLTNASGAAADINIIGVRKD